MVNAVYHPRTVRYLPETVKYLSSLGVRHIYLNPDYCAHWSKEEIDLVDDVYTQVAEQYIDYYLQHKPHFISLIDSKITVILREGYKEVERCRMGNGEFAFSPQGNIYPCERLIGSDTGNEHCIGNIDEGLHVDKMSCHVVPDQAINVQCLSCGVKDYCMNWCGCSNFFSTGYYNRVSPFLCASEKAAIRTAFDTFQTLEKKLGATFFEHMAGAPSMNIAKRSYKSRT